MKFRHGALAAASALVISTLGGAVAVPALADPTEWRTGWCAQDEGLSVVVDFGHEIGGAIPDEGYAVRCLVGGVVQRTSAGTRVDALRTVGFEVEAQGEYVTSVEGVEEFSSDEAMWWFFSGAVVPEAWNTAEHGIVHDGSNVNKAFGARLVGSDFVSVPRQTPQFATPAPGPAPEPDIEPTPAVVQGSVPVVSGEVRVGRQLVSAPGQWSDGASISRQWLRDGQPIPGAQEPRYRLTPADRGARITVAVTGTKAGLTATTMVSRPTGSVKAGRLQPVKPQVRGQAKVRKRLRAVTGTWKPAPVKLTHQWLRNGTAIKGARKKTYVLKPKDRGQRISVRVTATKPGYAKVTRTSKRTAGVSR